MSGEAVRVLVVDDNQEQLDTIRENLELRGRFLVTTAGDEHSAMSRLRADRPHVVVLDFKLAGKSTGLDVLKAIRAEDKYIPVVLLSAFAHDKDKVQLIHEGITFILEKGAPADALPELLERVAIEKHEIISSLEQWSDGNPAADEPAFALPGGGRMTIRQAVQQMKSRTPLGRILLEQYRRGVTEILAVGSKANDSGDTED